MELPIPEEPLNLKRRVLDLRSRLGPNVGIDWDNSALWFGNPIPSYLWKYWKSELRSRGFTWQKFLKLMKLMNRDALLWVNDKISWEEFVKRVIETIESPLGELLRN